MKLGFYAWNLFQVQHVAALLRRMEGATLLFHRRSGTDADAVLNHPSIADLADRAEILSEQEIPSIDQRFDALVFQTLFPGIEQLERCRLIALQYSMAKERHQYGAWRALADLNLVYGPWSAERIAPFGPVAQVGNPRWSDHFDAPLPALADLVPDYDPGKRTLLYLPTWEELSSVEAFAEAIAALRQDYNLLFVPHHNSRRFESERTAAALASITGSATTSLPLDVGHLIRASDAVLSDFSGAIFDALLFEKPVLLLQGDALTKIGRKFGPESIEFQRRDQIGPVVEQPEALRGRLDELLSGRLDYAAANRRLRQDCFAATRDSAERAITAIEEAVRNPAPRPAHQIYIAELCRESQERQRKLRELQRRNRRETSLLNGRARRQHAHPSKGTPQFGGGALFTLLARGLPSAQLIALAQWQEGRGNRDAAKAYTLAALAKGTRRSLAWTTQLFLREADESWRLAVLDTLLEKPEGALDPLLLRANRLQNIAGLRQSRFAERRLELRNRLRGRPRARVRDLRVAFSNRWLDDTEVLAARCEREPEQARTYLEAVETARGRLGPFAAWTEIANRNEMENLASGEFECLLRGEVRRLSDLPPGTQRVELPLPPYFYSQTVTEAQAHERICAFLRRVYAEVLASGAAILPRQQYMLTHADPSGQADLTLSYHTDGTALGRWHMKDSALAGYFTIDPQGYAGWSSIATMTRLPPEVEALERPALEANLQALRQETVETNRSKYSQPDRGAAQDLPERFVFLPLQVMDDAVQRLARIPLPELVAAMLEHARRTGEAVVLKRHPACNDKRVDALLRRAARLPGVMLTSASIHDILPRARAVVTINSGVGLEALIHERPVIAAGQAEYGYACAQVGSAAELHGRLRDLRFDAAWHERILRFLYFYRRHYLIDGEDTATLKQRLAAILQPETAATAPAARSETATRLS